MDSDEHSGNGSFLAKIISRLRLKREEPENINELQELIHKADKKQFLPNDVATMVDGVLQVSEMQVRDIMLPRSQTVVLDKNSDLEETLEIIIESAHSRFPVIDNSMDKVIGILLAKDLLHWCIKKNSYTKKIKLEEILRPVIFVPESKRLNIMLREFRNQRNHIAVVVDEYGGTAGIITIEDVLEQIVGDITDEHDAEDEHNILQHSKIRHTVKATTELEEFNKYFNAKFEIDDTDTIGGYVIRKFGYLPGRGETIDLDDFRFKVLRADKRRIYLLQVNIPKPDVDYKTNAFK